MPSCIGEIFIRPPTPDRPAHGRPQLHSVVRSPQNGVVRATGSFSEEPNSICPVFVSATAGALYDADGDLCSFSKIDDTLQSTKNMTVEGNEEKDRDSTRTKNAKKATRGPATPHARILIPEVRHLKSFASDGCGLLYLHFLPLKVYFLIRLWAKLCQGDLRLFFVTGESVTSSFISYKCCNNCLCKINIVQDV